MLNHRLQDIVLPETRVGSDGRKSSRSKTSGDDRRLPSNATSAAVKEIRPQQQHRPPMSSDGESQPPILHFAESPDPDPFNFMSTVKRKFQDEQVSTL